MPLNKNRIEKLHEMISTLEKVRDDEMAAGGGHLISEDLFTKIDELYEALCAELGISAQVDHT